MSEDKPVIIEGTAEQRTFFLPSVCPSCGHSADYDTLHDPSADMVKFTCRHCGDVCGTTAVSFSSTWPQP